MSIPEPEGPTVFKTACRAGGAPSRNNTRTLAGNRTRAGTFAGHLRATRIQRKEKAPGGPVTAGGSRSCVVVRASRLPASRRRGNSTNR